MIVEDFAEDRRISEYYSILYKIPANILFVGIRTVLRFFVARTRFELVSPP